MTSISFRGTFKSFWDLTGKSAMMEQSALLGISQPDFQNHSNRVLTAVNPQITQITGYIQCSQMKLSASAELIYTRE